MSPAGPGGGAPSTRGFLGAHLLLPSAGDYALDLTLSVGGGPVRLTLGPAPTQKPFSLAELVEGIAAALGLSDQLGPVAKLAASPPWDAIFATRIAPYVTVEVASVPSVQLLVQLYDSAGDYGLTIPPVAPPYWLKIEPTFTVYDLIVEYDKANGGVDVRARVTIPDQPAAALGNGPETPPKSEIVSYPFPTPPPRSPNLQVHYVGLGQRFGPTVDVTKPDPMAAMFDALESFDTNDPVKLLTTLAANYHPDRDWFVALDVELRGWRIRAVFNDPALYGLEVTCSDGAFAGLLFEILYQKLGPGLGVYYGALTLPTQFRRIQLGAVTLVLPSFKIWVYTNGDFKVCVGWPLGPDSIGVEVAIFTGGGGFYFAKLRSGDNPASGGAELVARGLADESAVPAYAPILEFGIGVWLGLGRSFQSGPFSASLSLTMQGTFQGVIAWQAPPAEDPNAAPAASVPDYYWFAATVSLIGQLQGEVDLKIVKLSVFVRLSVTAAVAVETGYGTVVNVSASVDVDASLRILFVTITVGFHATISQSFTLSTGPNGVASIDGPQTPPFQGMNDWALTGLSAPVARAVLAAAEPAVMPPVPTAPVAVDLYLLLQPAAVYTGGNGATQGVVTLLVECPAPAAPDGATDLEKLLGALESWLLRTWSKTGAWSEVVTALGSGRAPEPSGWDAALTTFLTTEVVFTLHPVDLRTVRKDEWHVGVFPVFDALQVAWGAAPPVPFATTAPTYPNYVQVVEEYFAELSLNALTANPDARGAARYGVAAAGDATGPTGPSLASHVFDDYFLTVARHVADSLAAKAVGSADLARDVAGLTSRYLLNALRLPDPATTPPAPPVDLSTLTIKSGYALDGQQVAVTTTETTFTATVSLGPDAGPYAGAIRFESGAAVTSTMPLAPLPAPPAPVWNGPGATIAVEALPAAHEQQVWSSQRTRLPWVAAGTERVVVPLPADLLATTAAGAVTLTVQTALPGTTPPGTVTGVRPALMVPLRLHLVDRTPAGALAGSVVENPHLTYVYRVDGTDDATRTRLEALLASGALAGATVDLLYDAPTTGYVSDALDPAKHPVLLAKTNLSTTTQPAAANALMRMPAFAEGPLGPVSAPFTPEGYPDLLRLVWEVSVVHAGGFYLRYQNAAGAPLPSTLFDQKGGSRPAPGVPSGTTADVTLMVTFPAGTFEPWHNALVVDPLPASTGSLYLGPSTASGAVTTLQPSYPPGCVAFRAAWTGAAPLTATGDALYDAAWVAAMYHLLQYRVDGAAQGSTPAFGTSLWSLGLAETDDPDGGTSYRQVVPAFRFAGSGASPYAAAGGKPQLRFRLDDVFGNALEDATYAMPFGIAYNDRILVPGAWPGISVAYAFLPAGATCGSVRLTKPALCLSLEFDPHAAGGAGTDQAAAVLFTYRTVAAQLADPNLSMTLSTTVLPSKGGVVDDGTLLRPALAAFVDRVLALLEGGGTDPVTASVAVPVDPTDLANRDDDIFPVEVSVTFARPPALVFTDVDGAFVPGSDTATAKVAANLSPPEGGTDKALLRASSSDGTPPEDVAIAGFATAFEAVFAGFDGAGGAARVAVRSGMADLAAPTDAASIWAFRWSAAKGVEVSFGAGPPAYFSMVPMSVLPMAGTVRTVTGYDASLAPAYGTGTFSGIDVDEWARSFLATVDRLTSPDLGTAAAAADPATYDLVMQAKGVLARCLANGVEHVFADPPSTGDLAAARDELEQASLVALGTAYTVSSVVQVPATIAVAGRVERDATVPPRLFGTLEATPTGAGSVTVTTAKLPLAPAGADAPAWLTFLVTATDPTAVADVPMTVVYRPRFVEHEIDQADEDFGYVPSQWLRVALPREDDFLDLALGSLDAPVPARDVPAVPALSGQRATQSAGGSYFDWDYAARVVLADGSAQDALWVDVTYNLPLTSARSLAAEGDPLTVLFATLAEFTTAWAYLGPMAEAFAAAQEDDTPGAAALLGAVWQQVKSVAEAWAALRGVAVPWPTEALVSDAAPGNDAPLTVDHYEIVLKDMWSGTLHVYARAPLGTDGKCDPGAICWPVVDGQGRSGAPVPVCADPAVPCTDSPTADACWYRADYPCAKPPAGPVSLAIVWPGLDVLTRQTAVMSCWVVRNADLSAAPAPVNPAFVYRTAEAAFASPVVPLMVVPEVPVTPPGATLAGTLATALADVARSGSVDADRFLRLEMRYSYGLGPAGVRATTAVLLANDVHLLPDGAAPVGDAVTLAQFTARLAGSADAWFRSTGPVTTDASLEMSVVVFATVAGSSLPLVRFDLIPVTVPAGWWP